MGYNNQYNAIKNKYKTSSVEDTLKLLLRNRILFSSRKICLKVFDWISRYKIWKVQFKDDCQWYSQNENAVYYESVNKSYLNWKDILKELESFITKYLDQNSGFGKFLTHYWVLEKTFVINGTDWNRYWKLWKEEVEIKFGLIRPNLN